MEPQHPARQQVNWMQNMRPALDGWRLVPGVMCVPSVNEDIPRCNVQTLAPSTYSSNRLVPGSGSGKGAVFTSCRIAPSTTDPSFASKSAKIGKHDFKLSLRASPPNTPTHNGSIKKVATVFPSRRLAKSKTDSSFSSIASRAE